MAENVTKPARRVKNQAQVSTAKAAEAVNKTAEAVEKTAERAAEAAFQMPAYTVPEAFRSFSEQSLQQSRNGYARLKAAAEEASDALEETLSTTRDGLLQVQVRALDAARANTDATLDFVRNLLGVTSVADAVQLQTTFARQRFEAFVDYSKDVQATMNKVSAEAAKPAKVLFDRTVSLGRAA